ncbi:MAG: phosphotriesterase [Eubacteriales bacterium]
MSNIRTVLKDIKPNTLGWCQCHEHIFLEKGKSWEINPALCMDDYEKSLAELKLYKKSGGVSLVDAQPVACGRMAEYLGTASEKSGVNIVASTGFHKLMFYETDSIVFSYTEEQLARLFIEEIEQGMYSSAVSGFKKTGYRAGMIKIAVDTDGVYADATTQKLFKAAATAAKETGRPLMCHMEKGADAMEVVAFFEKQAVSTERLILCHLDRTHYDFAYHRAVAETGAYLEYDTIHRLKYHDDETEAKLIMYMLEEGYDSQLLVGLDTTNQRLKSYGADMGLDFILNDFSKRLLRMGMKKEILYKMIIDNPQCALSQKV